MEVILEGLDLVEGPPGSVVPEGVGGFGFLEDGKVESVGEPLVLLPAEVRVRGELDALGGDDLVGFAPAGDRFVVPDVEFAVALLDDVGVTPED